MYKSGSDETAGWRHECGPAPMSAGYSLCPVEVFYADMQHAFAAAGGDSTGVDVVGQSDDPVELAMKAFMAWCWPSF